MKVLLTREVAGLGIPGDVVEVKDGYARNYLLPRKLGVVPTPHELARFGQLRSQYEAELADRHTQAQALAEKLAGVELLFTRRVHDADKLYASVRPQDVAKEIADRFGVKIDPERIRMETVDTLGEHQAEIQLYEDITATVKLIVTPAA
ncbi:MAG TPA: 50S ribosomal protein L9 [Candidatus Bipolaricaulis sp.]|nr:50S ribosomal protein L9 [Candidatus Bipolaricaulis sp.]HPD06638.1 50S ribosomal protein L9 [Candidatus Bipolaricaulis sp.]HRS13734.1 50S ribosomal protein L9 [Candidatus Bipolaricaulis sp.]HRU21558.1 50S ribosomal protein L9 [Candidatus Bipolaricaulis sp.]